MSPMEFARPGRTAACDSSGGLRLRMRAKCAAARDYLSGPLSFFLYILAYLDRVNVSVAGLRMELPASEGGLGFTKEIIGFGAGSSSGAIGFWKFPAH